MYRIVLIGCSKQKLPYVYDPRRGGRVKPEELYCGALFRKRVEYARRQSCPWFVLSALFGLWPEDSERNPTYDGVVYSKDGKTYDTRLSDLDAADRAAWITSVSHRVVEQLWEPYNEGLSDRALRPDEMIVEIHAGSEYAHPLAEILRSIGIVVELPCRGLGIGEQLALYTTGPLSEREFVGVVDGGSGEFDGGSGDGVCDD